MVAYFDALPFLQKIYLITAIIGALGFITYVLMQFMGGDVDADGGGHHYGDVSGGDEALLDSDDAFKIFSFQTMTSFFLMFGLIGLATSEANMIDGGTMVCAALAGVAAVILMDKVTQSIQNLSSSGTLDHASAVGQEGEVYLTIHPGGNAQELGKVIVVVNNRQHEYEAMSKNGTELKTGTRVRVVKLTQGNRLVVDKADAEASA